MRNKWKRKREKFFVTTSQPQSVVVALCLSGTNNGNSNNNNNIHFYIYFRFHDPTAMQHISIGYGQTVAVAIVAAVAAAARRKQLFGAEKCLDDDGMDELKHRTLGITIHLLRFSRTATATYSNSNFFRFAQTKWQFFHFILQETHADSFGFSCQKNATIVTQKTQMHGALALSLCGLPFFLSLFCLINQSNGHFLCVPTEGTRRSHSTIIVNWSQEFSDPLATPYRIWCTKIPSISLGRSRLDLVRALLLNWSLHRWLVVMAWPLIIKMTA